MPSGWLPVPAASLALLFAASPPAGVPEEKYTVVDAGFPPQAASLCAQAIAAWPACVIAVRGSPSRIMQVPDMNIVCSSDGGLSAKLPPAGRSDTYSSSFVVLPGPDDVRLACQARIAAPSAATDS